MPRLPRPERQRHRTISLSGIVDGMYRHRAGVVGAVDYAHEALQRRVRGGNEERQCVLVLRERRGGLGQQERGCEQHDSGEMVMAHGILLRWVCAGERPPIARPA